MSTILQKRLAKAIIENATRKKPKNKKELVVLGGYSKVVAEAKPQVIIEQKGVQEELRNYGLTEELIETSLVSDIKKKPKKRLGELRLGADILGMTEGRPGAQTLVIQVAAAIQNKYDTNLGSRSDTP